MPGVVRESARTFERDRYLSALLAPHAQRHDLIILAAFLGEVGRIPLIGREPMVGVIKLQWWHDALDRMGTDVQRDDYRTGSPVADAFLGLCARRSLPRERVHALLDAQETLLVSPPFPDGAAAMTYCDATEGAGFLMTAGILDLVPDAALNELCRATGRAYGLARLLRAQPLLRALGRDPFPSFGNHGAVFVGFAHKYRAAALRLLERANRRTRTAVLPLALVEPYLQAFQGLNPDPVPRAPDISPLLAPWRLWRAQQFGWW